MSRKMIARQVGVLTLCGVAAGGCYRHYVATSLRGELDLSGSYVVRSYAVSNSCDNVSTREVRSRLDVQHQPGALRLTVVFEGDPYAADVNQKGKFSSETIQRTDGGATETANMTGQFGDSTISASLRVKRAAVRPVLPTSQTHLARACEYHVNIQGTRIAEGR